MATVKFPSEMPSAADVGGNDKLMISKDGSGEAFQVSFNDVKQYLEITDIELDPVQGGSSSGSATVIPNGPSGQNRKMDASPGWYSVGGVPVEATAGHVWKWFWNGSSWSLVDMGELPVLNVSEVLNPESTTDVPSSKAVADYSLSNNSSRILPIGYEIDEIDRPDLELPDFISIDSQGNILTQNWDLDYSLLKDYSIEDYDRPDLGDIVQVDKNNILLSSSSGTKTDVTDIIKSTLFSKKYYEPESIPAFSTTTLADYNSLITDWDIIKDKGNEGLEVYCTKSEKGKSSTKDMPIFCYEFKPQNPALKVLLVTGMHGSEKVYIHILKEFFKNLVFNWKSDLLLQWLRFNVHFVVLPCLSPSAMSGRTEGSLGGRRVHETEPIPVTWTKVGNEATITFNPVDFPDTDGRLDGNTYFSNPNIVGKTWVSIFDSDNTALGNKGYVISEVLDGRTIKVLTANEISGSGTAKIYVGTDINRNMQADGDNSWDLYTPSTTGTIYSNDWVACANDNKGTKPFSLNESIILKDLLLAHPDILFYADLHAGAGTNYLHWNTKTYPSTGSAVEELKEHQSTSNKDGYSRVRMDANNVPYSYRYSVLTIDRQGFSLEWAQSTTEIDSKNATDAMRWLNTFLISFIRNLQFNK